MRFRPDPDEDVDAWLDEHDTRMVDDFRVVNGAGRMVDGTFGMVPARKFPADGRQHITMDRQLELALKIRTLTEVATCGRPLEVPYRLRRQQKGPLKKGPFQLLSPEKPR